MNSKYFHSLMKHKRRRCNVVLLDENGERIEDVAAVKLGLRHHFEGMFLEACHHRPNLNGLNFNRVSEMAALWLVPPFTEVEEIRAEVWNCDGVKSLGPDGFNFRFIK